MMKNKFDFKRAFSLYQDRGYFNGNVGENGEIFFEYSPSYITTNEDLRAVFEVLNPSGKCVLANTGSGDAPLFYRAYGAAHVDSFDISYCAKSAMDMKVAALRKGKSLKEYTDFLYKLYPARQFEQFQDVVDKCPVETRTFIKKMTGRAIFCNGTGVREGALPSQQEYDIMKQVANKNIPFIWSDLNDLSKKLTKKYDEIYLSNILQYDNSAKNITRILNDLKPYLNIGGHIVVHITWFFGDCELRKYKSVSDNVQSWADMLLVRDRECEFMFLTKKAPKRYVANQRTR